MGLTDGPLVTVVVAVRNGEAFLNATLISVRRQTYSNIEVIVVDDGSTDGTSQVARMHCADDKRINLVQSEPVGAGAARNLGIKQASGEIIALLDGDDLMHPDLLSEHVKRFQNAQFPVDVVWSPGVVIDQNDSIVAEVVTFDRSTISKVEGWVLLPMLYRYFPLSGGTSFRLSCIREEKGYKSDVMISEDYEMMLRIAERRQIGVVNRHLLGYRRVPGSRSHRFRDSLQVDKAILRSLRTRNQWVPIWVWRWSLASRYLSVSSKAMQSRSQFYGISCAMVATFLDPLVLLQPGSLRQGFQYLFRDRKSGSRMNFNFPDEIESFLDQTTNFKSLSYKTFEAITRRRHRRMVKFEYEARLHLAHKRD